MEYLYGVLSSISRDLVCGVVNQLRYPCCFNIFVEELAKEEDNLIATRNSVKDRSAHAKKQTRKTAEVVDKWLENAEIDVDNVNNLLNEARTKNSCCFGHCPNWIWRYNLGKKLANKKTELENFIKEGGQYIQLERVATLPSGILDLSSEKYLSFGSRQKAYEELMEAVKDDEVGMVGLYGMGGCGKTTMAMEVQKKAEAGHLFDKVLFVPVSSTVEVRSIQDKIASSLGFDFPKNENEERERAKRLYMRLTQENKILVILDDVWQILDFGAIGIPSTEHHKGCKVLITTRSEDVCNSMDCKKKIQLPILKEEEAWALFQNEARISEGTSDTIKHLARQISDECKGLPVAVAAVASTLKGKDDVIWKVALNKLKSSKPINIEKGLQDPYKCLELSYHYLDTEKAKSLFLLCSVFPEDYEIPIELLTRCAIGLGVVGEVCSYDEARSEVIAAKIKLKSCCLLLDAGGERVKMHDLVRDVAHWIAKNENKGIKCKVENEATLEQNSIRYLWCKKLPNDLDCSNLEFLYVTRRVEVLDESFTRMGKLRVLCLVKKGGGRLPLSTISFKTLTNLRCLILWGWTLSDISFVRYMKNLESLSLNDCSLPSFLDLQKDDAVTQLSKLKLLVLHRCDMERSIFEVIGRIPQLEELCMVGPDENTIEFFKSFSVSQTLQRYTITLGIPCPPWGFLTPPERTLWLTCFDISNEAIMGLAKKAKNLRVGNIKGGAKNIIPNIFQLEGGGMPELNELEISECEEIECLVDSSNHTSKVVGSLFSSLKNLLLRNCPKLTSLFTQAIIPNPVRYTIFQNLQQVRIEGLPQLKYVFSASTVGGLPQLETLTIRDCNQLEQIVEDIIPSLANELEMIEENTSAPSAPLLNHRPGSFTLSKLTRLVLNACPKLDSLFPASTAKTLISLEELSIKDCHGLKYLLTCERDYNNKKQNSVEDDHDVQSVISMFPSLKSLDIDRCDLLQHIFPVFHVGGQNNIEHNSFTLQHLTTLQIKECAKLEVIFPVSVVICLPELERLEIKKCKELKHIMEEDSKNDRIQRELKPCFPKLKKLVVKKCHKLKRLFSTSASNHLPNLEDLIIDEVAELEEFFGFEQGASKNCFTFQFQHLKSLKLRRCAKLEVIFPLSVIRCQPELVRLEIRKCKALKHIMEEDENHRIQRELKPYFPKLTVVFVGQCHKLKRLFSASASDDLPNLEVLVINKANELEELIGCEQREDEEIGKAKVELPKLKLLIFMHLPNLCQGIELCAVKHRIINNCPKLSLTSTTTLQELYANIPDSDFKIIGFSLRELRRLIDEIISNEVSERGGTSEIPSSQMNEKLEKKFIGEVHGSEVHATATSTNSELNGRSSLSPLDVCQHETHSKNIKSVAEEGTMSNNTNMTALSMHFESATSQSGQLVTSQSKSYQHVAEPSKPVDKGKKKMVDQPKTAPKPIGEKLMSSAINSSRREELEIHQVSSTAVGRDNQEPLVEISHDSTAEVTSSLKSPTIPVSANDVEIVEPSIDAQASKDNLSMLEDIGESHPSEEVVEETAMKQDPKNDESETSTNPSANPFVSPTPEEDREGPTSTTPDDSDDEFEEDFKAFDVLTEWEQGLIPKASESTINKPDQRAECEIFRTSFREKAFNVDILTIASEENLKVEVEDAAAKLLSFGGLVPEKERVQIQMFLDLLDEAVSKVKLQKNQQIQIDNIKNTSLDQRNQIEFSKQQANTSKLSFKENKSELVKLHASEKVLIEKIAALQLELSSVQLEKQTLESRQNDLRQTIKSSAAHAKSVAEQLKGQLEKKLQLETSQDELAESLKSLKKKQKTQGQNYFM